VVYDPPRLTDWDLSVLNDAAELFKPRPPSTTSQNLRMLETFYGLVADDNPNKRALRQLVERVSGSTFE
jgi:hypothetical protein